MPIVHVTAPDKYDRQQLGAIADGVHKALVSAIGIPEGDRFQVVAVHAPEVFSFDPHYLGVERRDVVAIEITLVVGRTDEMKRRLYREITANLVAAGVRSEDVFVVLTETQRSDWSVGNGDAQLLDLALE
jgi:phenylpyruvate tautomerase PptA (4-oxalocrotonate tautomerase family)